MHIICVLSKHMKRPSNALNVDRMNVRDGGKQPFMRDTVWHGELIRWKQLRVCRWDEDGVGGEGSGHSRNGRQEDEGTASPVSGKL